MNPAEVNMAERLIVLSPEVLAPGRNVRFGLRDSRIKALAANIAEVGRIREPLEVTPLETITDGKEYEIVSGNYRHAAALVAKVECPCIVLDPLEAKARFSLQLDENVQREDMTPMDKAVAIKQAFELGFTRQEIMAKFGTWVKGKLVPASNSIINIYLSFNDFPKKYQTMIHEGQIQVSGAMELARSPRDKWDGIIARIDAEREKELALQEKDEQRLLKDEEKDAKAQAELERIKKERQEILDRAREREDERKALADKAAELFKQSKTLPKGEERDKVEAEFKTVDAELKDVEKKSITINKLAESMVKKEKTAEEKIQERREKLELARKALKSKPVTQTEVKKAAKAEGSPASGLVPLKSQEIRKIVDDLCLPGSFPLVQKIGEAFRDCISGATTDKQLLNALVKITGEKKSK